MSIFIAVLGLALLILVHEAGHFFGSLAVGLRPRSSMWASRPLSSRCSATGSSTASARSRSAGS